MLSLDRDLDLVDRDGTGWKNTNFIVDQLLETSSIWIRDTDGFDHDTVVNIRGPKKKRTDK